MAEKAITGWPAPWTPLNKSLAGALIGVSKDTIERVAGAIERGEQLPKVRNPQAIQIGKMFAAEGVGSSILAERIYKEVLKIDPTKLSGPFISPPTARAAPIKPRKRSVVPNKANLDGMNDAELRQQLNEVIARVQSTESESKSGRVPWQRIKAIAEALKDRGLPPSGMLHGQPLANIDLKRCETWGFVGVFLAQAQQGDCWPFVLPLKGGRPVDLFAASTDDIKYGQCVALTLEDLLMLLSEGLAADRAKAFAEHEEKEIFDTMHFENRNLT